MNLVAWSVVADVGLWLGRGGLLLVGSFVKTYADFNGVRS